MHEAREAVPMVTIHGNVFARPEEIDAACAEVAIRYAEGFAEWARDNYSTNTKQGGVYPLPYSKWRKDFTDEIFTTAELRTLYDLHLAQLTKTENK